MSSIMSPVSMQSNFNVQRDSCIDFYLQLNPTGALRQADEYEEID